MNLDFTNQELYDNGINLDVVIVKPGYEDIDKVKKLFDVSFEGEERPKITNLLRDDDKLEFYAFYNDGNFIGASVWVNIMKKIMYGLWLAVNPEFRGYGYGTQIVKFTKLLARKRGKVYMGTIQDPNEKSDNQEYRKFRWNFYKKLGFHLTNYGYTDGKENLKMITLNGRVGKNISNKAVEEAFKYYNNTLNETFNNEIQAQEDNINNAINDLSYIQFKDPEVERICHEKLHVYTYEDAKKITNIPLRCFYSRKIESFDELKYFTNLKEIGTNAFLGCDKLKSIILPDSITTIKGGVFCCCDSLEYIKLPKNLQNIAPELFFASNIKQIIIPNKVTTIGDMAFQRCKYLQQIIIPNSVYGIEDRAFNLCESLQQITIPDNIRYIGNDAFNRCKNLEAIYVSKENYEKFKDREFGTLLKIKNDSNLINETFNNEIQTQNDDINDAIDDLSYIQFEDPEVERICHEQLYVYTYEDAKKIIELNVKSGFYSSEIKYFNELKYFINLKKIDDYAFTGCKSLQQINIPNGITKIKDYAFCDCKSLQQINIPNSITEIGNAAFFNCKSLQHINIPNKVTKIGNNAFECCKSLQSINIPDDIMEIGQNVFTYCDNLKNIYVSKENYTKLRKYKFRNFLKIVDNNNSNLINETFNNEIQAEDDSNIDQTVEEISISKNIISQDNFYQLLLKFLKNNKFIDESKEGVLGVKQWYGHHEKGYYYNKYLPPKVENENEIYSMHTLNIVLVDIPQINEDTEQHQHDIVYIKILSNPNLDYDIDKDSNTFNITLNYAPNILLKDDLSYNKTKFNYKIQYPILDMNYEKMINLNGYFTYRMSTAAVYDIKNIITKMFYNNNYLKDLLINDYEVLGYPCLDDVRFNKYVDGFLDKCHF